MTTDHPITSGPFAGAEIIYRYTVEQAVADGELKDCLKFDEAGAADVFRRAYRGNPVYMSNALHALVYSAVANPKWSNDFAGVYHDITWMARGAVAKAQRQAEKRGDGRATFVVIITGAGRVRNQRLDVVINGDGLTFLLEGED